MNEIIIGAVIVLLIVAKTIGQDHEDRYNETYTEQRR